MFVLLYLTRWLRLPFAKTAPDIVRINLCCRRRLRAGTLDHRSLREVVLCVRAGTLDHRSLREVVLCVHVVKPVTRERTHNRPFFFLGFVSLVLDRRRCRFRGLRERKRIAVGYFGKNLGHDSVCLVPGNSESQIAIAHDHSNSFEHVSRSNVVPDEFPLHRGLVSRLQSDFFGRNGELGAPPHLRRQRWRP
jgi:hypothetical protein